MTRSITAWLASAALSFFAGIATPACVHAQAPAAAAAPQTAAQRLFGDVNPKLAALTDDVLFGDVWARPGLSPRDRSLVTISVLIATGNTAPLNGHLNRAFTNGVKPGEASALLAHLAIYCGWPRAV